MAITALDSPLSQNFDTLANAGTSSTVPAGWEFVETGANANTTYTAGTGSSNAGDTYSFGAPGSTERAFGSVSSGSLASTIGVNLVNSTGLTITALTVAYSGEQWRLGAPGRLDWLDFAYSPYDLGLANSRLSSSISSTSPARRPQAPPARWRAIRHRTVRRSARRYAASPSPRAAASGCAGPASTPPAPTTVWRSTMSRSPPSTRCPNQPHGRWPPPARWPGPRDAAGAEQLT